MIHVSFSSISKVDIVYYRNKYIDTDIGKLYMTSKGPYVIFLGS